MGKTALFVRHRARPGQRQRVQEVWEKHVKPRVEANPSHEAYYFCHDADDPDVVCVFQLLSDADAVTAFMAGDWYPVYLEEVTRWVAEAPSITTADVAWVKGR